MAPMEPGRPGPAPTGPNRSDPGLQAPETAADLGPAPAGSTAGDDLVPADEPEVLGGRNGSLRRCIVSGVVGKKDRMVRFVIGPGEEIVPDLEETLPGRGLWLTAEGNLVEKALAKNAFSRAARRKVTVPPDLRDRLAQLLRRRALDLIGLAARGGAAVAGFDKARDALASGRVGGRGVPGLWLEASDGAADGRRKLAGPAAGRGLAPVALFGRAELGRALGREEAVHVVLADGPLAGRLRREIARLSLLLGVAGPVAPEAGAAGARAAGPGATGPGAAGPGAAGPGAVEENGSGG